MPGFNEIRRYRIEQPPIGQGGMGIVYKAYDSVTRRAVAIKTLKGSADSESLESFQKEWSILAGLCHPNIVDILDIGEFAENDGRKPYFVMPLLPGATFDDLMKRFGSALMPERVIEIITQTCRGLQAAHDKRVIHRDLKPSNLFVMEDDTVKIIDFGVVHLADTESRTAIKGTLPYMAPEQLEFKPATAKSDIFSLAVVCYEALTGRKPFDRATAEETIEAIRHQMPVPVSDLNSAVNVQTSRVVQKALAKQPYHRFSSAREFADALQRSLRNEANEQFDPSRIQPRLTRVKKLLGAGDYALAFEILGELESEGNIDPEIFLLRVDVERAMRSKKIQQLLEDARTRIEEEEYPLALHKVQSVLELDASNIDAHALKADIERQRSAAQIDKWYQIAQQHLENKLFAKARQGVQEIFKINPAHKGAREMLAEISRAEEELAKVRKEKQQFYDFAHKAYGNGELSSALRLLERVIELGKSTPGHPNTDARYFEFYEQVRREHDEFASAYADGKEALASNDFAKALEICNQVLNRRPSEPLFQALKIEVEDVQRQQNSSAIAHLHSQIEAEPDLNIKFAMLKGAVEQFPGEQAFAQLLNLIKARRNLVNDIVRRARQYESQDQFVEAANQWETLRTIYKQYPGLDYELQRLAKKQEENLGKQVKARLLERIDQALVAGDYESANELLSSALAESAEDEELLRLKQQAEKGAENSRRAQELFEEGRHLAASGNHTLAIQKLRDARQLDARNQSLLRFLNSVLVDHSRNLAEQDWRAAVPFIEEALDNNPDDLGAAGVSQLIADMEQRDRIDRYVDQARNLRAQGKLAEAISMVETGLRQSPRDTRLLQLGTSLRELQRQAEFDKTIEIKAAARAQAAAVGGGTRAVDVSLRPMSPLDASSFLAPAIEAETRGYNVRARSLDRRDEPSLSRAVDPKLAPAVYAPYIGWLKNWQLGNRSVLIWAAVILVASAIITITAMSRWRNSYKERQNQISSIQRIASRTTATATDPIAHGSSPVPGTGVPSTQPAIPPAAPVAFHFESSPASGRVEVDNDTSKACFTPCDLQLPNGRHTFTLNAPGYSEHRGILQIPDERSKLLTLLPDLKTVRLISVPPDLEVSVDGKSAGQTPATLHLSVGQHLLTFKEKGRQEERTINVTDTDPQIFTAKLYSESAADPSVPKSPL
ncbi:MAG: protein kinase domain-containing protein [Bryobacteraceae bacterium]